jgi:hypothetical protein
MKSTCVFAALASVSAVAPPRISLNLEGMSQSYKLNESIERPHDLQYENHNVNDDPTAGTPSGTTLAVKSQQDWTEKCPAKQATAVNCPQPEAMAYDHFDQDVEVTTRLFLVDFEGTATTAATVLPAAANMVKKANTDALEIDISGSNSFSYEYKATYLFKYDAQDKAGNYAEQVVFALILDDTRSPWFDQSPTEDSAFDTGVEQTVLAPVACVNPSPNNVMYAPALTVEAVSDWRLCELTASDNYDTSALVTGNIEYEIEYLGRDHDTFPDASASWHGSAHPAVPEDSLVTDLFGKTGGGTKTVNTLSYTDAAAYFNRDCNSNTFDRLANAWYHTTAARKRCGPEQVGKFLVTATTHDNAGVYGHNAADNVVSLQTAILIQDTTKPTIFLEGHNPVFVECLNNGNAYTSTADLTDRRGYIEEGAICHDTLDTDALGQPLEVTFLPQNMGARPSDCNVSDNANAVGCKINSATTGGAYSASEVTPVTSIGNFLRVDDQSGSAHSTKDRLIEYQCQDFALNSANTVYRTIKTQDTESPTITLTSGNDIVTYSEKHCAMEDTDAIKSCFSGDTTAAEAWITSMNNDQAQNNGAGRSFDHLCDTTTTACQDKIKCLRQICENTNHMTSQAYGVANGFTDPGVAVTEDRCDEDITTASVTMSWGPKDFNARILGDYVRTYTVSDNSNNVAFKTRTFTVIDDDQPIITIVDATHEGCPEGYPTGAQCYEANRDIEYTDAGATCEDWVDGELSHAVEVSGEVVNFRIPGTYTIQYNCQDLTGNDAHAQTRTVIIRDTVQPRITLNGAIVNFIEAGFPYIDAGATATDTLDGDITQYLWTDGNTVNDKRAYYAYSDCDKIANTGEYYLTLKDDAGKFHRELVHCASTPADGKFGFKLTANTDATRTNAETCESIGMQLLTLSAESATMQAKITLLLGDAAGVVDAAGTRFLCKLKASTTDASDVMNNALGVVTDQVQNAEQGRYLIHYHVEDKAGNREFAAPTRTVIVKDTLPPVVSLSMQRDAQAQMELVKNIPAQTQWSRADQKSRHGHNYYMAEAGVSANGFFIGAIASAVAGVALLGLSMRKSSQTSVPV